MELASYLQQSIFDESNDLSELRELIRRGASIERSSAMVHAASHDSVPLIETLIDLGGNLNHQNERRQTPLHKEAGCRNPRVVRFLVGSGADTDARDETGYEPIDWLQEKLFEKTRIIPF